MEPIRATVPARVGLLGNPSDLYEGKALAFAYADHAATVHMTPARGCQVGTAPPAPLAFGRLDASLRSSEGTVPRHGNDLLLASLAQFARGFPEFQSLVEEDPRLQFSLQFESNIPFQAGLAGSSAIIIATLRALCEWFDVHLDPHAVAEAALAAETDLLGITAGPMDRVIQSFGGLLLIDFQAPRTPERYEPVDPACLPPLRIAWDPNPGTPSGSPHQAVRKRWLAGDPHVRAAIARFPGIVDEGMAALARGDMAAFQAAVNANFDTRASIWPLAKRDRELIDIARNLGAASKFAGSGGAAVLVLRSEDEAPALESAYRAAGFQTLSPRVGVDAAQPA